MHPLQAKLIEHASEVSTRIGTGAPAPESEVYGEIKLAGEDVVATFQGRIADVLNDARERIGSLAELIRKASSGPYALSSRLAMKALASDLFESARALGMAPVEEDRPLTAATSPKETFHRLAKLVEEIEREHKEGFDKLNTASSKLGIVASDYEVISDPELSVWCKQIELRFDKVFDAMVAPDLEKLKTILKKKGAAGL